MIRDLAKGASVQRTMSNRALRPNEQLKILARVWGNEPGYVFLPWINGSASTKEARKRGYHEGKAYRWPRQRDEILAHLNNHADDDVYFCPNKFVSRRRAEEQVLPERVMYADLDEVDPRTLDEGDQPSIAWQSSPGRYQGVWLMRGENEGATAPGGINHRLTYHLDADKSGWDSTQLLRVPGRPNHKPDYRRNGKPVEGKLLWANGGRYNWDDWEDIADIKATAGAEDLLIDQISLDEINGYEVLARLKGKLSSRVRSLLRAKQPNGEDRSGVLWEIERELADAGCKLVEIVKIVQDSCWNKYEGRSDELKRLKTEAAKAIHESKTGAVLDTEPMKPQSLMSVADLYEETIKPPRWLVKNIWTEGSVGFIAGAPKSYKSWFSLDLAVSMATGMPFLNNPSFGVIGGKKRVLYIAEEDGVSLIRERLDYIVDAKDPHLNPDGWCQPVKRNGRLVLQRNLPREEMSLYMHVRKGFVLSDKGWQDWLEKMVVDHELDMVIIDTLSTVAGGVDIDKSSELMNKILNPLKAINRNTQVAIALVHHNRKEASSTKNGDNPTLGLSDRAGRDMLGSVALHAWVENALYVRAKRNVDSMPHLSGTDDHGNILPVRGTEVFVERESKSAEDLKFRVMVPMMRRSATQSARFAEVFDVDVRMKWQDHNEDDVQAGGHEEKSPDNVTDIKPNKYGQLPQGVLVVKNMKMGGCRRVGESLSDKYLADMAGTQIGNVRRQLQAAQGKGWVEKLMNGEYGLTVEGLKIAGTSTAVLRA